MLLIKELQVYIMFPLQVHHQHQPSSISDFFLMHSKLNPKYHNIFLHSLASASEILAYLLHKSALQAKGTATPAAVFLGLICRSSFRFQHMCSHTVSCQPVKAWGPARSYKGCSCHDNWEGAGHSLPPPFPLSNGLFSAQCTSLCKRAVGLYTKKGNFIPSLSSMLSFFLPLFSLDPTNQWWLWRQSTRTLW